MLILRATAERADWCGCARLLEGKGYPRGGMVYVSVGLRTFEQFARRVSEDEERHAGRHDRGGPGAASRGRAPDARLFFRPAAVSDLRCQGPRGGLWRPRAPSRRETEIHQHGRN